MLNNNLNMPSVSFEVDYHCPPEFSRGYSRQFGKLPRSEVGQIRRGAAA